MDNLTITKERVLEAASKCPAAKETLETLFPEAFQSDAVKKFEDAIAEVINDGLLCDYSKVYNKIPGHCPEGKAKYIIKLLGLE